MKRFFLSITLSLGLLSVFTPQASAQTKLGEAFKKALNDARQSPSNAEQSCKSAPMDEAQVIQRIGANAYFSVGTSHALYLDQRGEVWGWGDNLKGLLAQGKVVGTDPTGGVTTQWPGKIFGEPMKIGVDGAKAVYATAENSYVLKQDGTVWAWGKQQLNGMGHQIADPWPIPVQVAGIPKIAFLRPWDRGVHAFAYDGSVWVWGYGNPAATLQGYTDRIVRSGGYPSAVWLYRPTQAKLGCLSDSQIAMDESNSVVLTNDRKIVHTSWGVSRTGANIYRLLSNGDRNASFFDLQYGADESGNVFAWSIQDVTSATQVAPPLRQLTGLGTPTAYARDDFDVFLQPNGSLIVWGRRTQASYPFLLGAARADNLPASVNLPFKVIGVVSHPSGIFLISDDRSIYKRDKFAEQQLSLRKGVGTQRVILIHKADVQ
jgi:Regulator of chromosome condensation (RCC1) repeat